MEEILLRRAEAGDALLLTELRKTVLIAANRLPEDADLSAIEEPCRLYFADTRRQTTYLAFCAEEIAGGFRGLSHRDAHGFQPHRRMRVFDEHLHRTRLPQAGRCAADRGKAHRGRKGARHSQRAAGGHRNGQAAV